MSRFDKNANRSAALKYSPGRSAAPVVVAAGMGYAARKIVQIALENNIPVYEDDSLATILSQLETDSEIPPELYKAVVEVYIYFLGFASDSRLPAGDA